MGSRVLINAGWYYDDASTFLEAHKYENLARWVKQIAERPAVKRGRIVNRSWGELSEQLKERHNTSDFEKMTEDKLVG